MGNTYRGASLEKPEPAKAFSTTGAKFWRVTVKVGIPSFSILAAARPHAVEQDPHAALPVMTACPPFSFTRCPILSVSMLELPRGNSV